jgi:hypothetical protein
MLLLDGGGSGEEAICSRGFGIGIRIRIRIKITMCCG